MSGVFPFLPLLSSDKNCNQIHVKIPVLLLFVSIFDFEFLKYTGVNLEVNVFCWLHTYPVHFCLINLSDGTNLRSIDNAHGKARGKATVF